jgi:TDG/mug DNA glycosylase family protein
MDPKTAHAYESAAGVWVEQRRPEWLDDGRLDAFARDLRPGARVADLGCGPGWYAEALRTRGFRPIAADLSAAMLAEAGRRAPDVPRVRADLFALPFARGSLDAAWAVKCYQHLPLAELPVALARLHGALRRGGSLRLTLANLAAAESASLAERARGIGEQRFDDAAMQGRLFTLLDADTARALVVGAGFDRVRCEAIGRRDFWLWIEARRARTLPDWIAPGLRLLVCGLNPSLYSADLGLPFARPGNRFWGAARGGGLILRERDLEHALARGIGFTDLVKRATARASALRPAEYAHGLRRVEALVRRFEPGAICFVGLDGWRRAADPRARPGWIAGGFAGRPAYLMPSTSGLNARVSARALAAHLRRASAPDRA